MSVNYASVDFLFINILLISGSLSANMKYW